MTSSVRVERTARHGRKLFRRARGELQQPFRRPLQCIVRRRFRQPQTLLMAGLELYRKRVRFGFAYVFRCVRGEVPPVDLPSHTRTVGSRAVRRGSTEVCIGEDINHAGWVRVHWLFLSGLEPVLQDPYAVVLEANVVQLRREFYRIGLQLGSGDYSYRGHGSGQCSEYKRVDHSHAAPLCM